MARRPDAGGHGLFLVGHLFDNFTVAAQTRVIRCSNFTVMRNAVIAVYTLVFRSHNVMAAGSGTFLIIFLSVNLMMACAALKFAVLSMIKHHRFLCQIHSKRFRRNRRRSGKGRRRKCHGKQSTTPKQKQLLHAKLL